jgi:integrase
LQAACSDVERLRTAGIEDSEWLLWVEQQPLRSAQNRSPFIEEEVDMETLNSSSTRRVPWNKGRLTGQKPPLKLREIWAIRTRLQMSSNVRELALFNLAIDSKLRACDLTRLQVQDICMGSHVVSRATFMQQKTQRPVQFEITEQTRQSVAAWISARGLRPADYLFPSRLHASAHVSTRQ